jgi:thioredoxin reductase (NADPH)
VARDYDVIIVGGGPAGLTAGIYAARARLRTLLVERGVIGGQIANAELVENFPGFPDGISGFELGQLMEKQAIKYGLEILAAGIVGIELDRHDKVVTTTEGVFQARALIIAGGSEHRKLGVPGEEEFLGKGVSYCATCDGAFFSDQAVAMVGGGDAAITEAHFLTRFASRVTVIHRRDQLRAGALLRERAAANPKIDFLWNSVVEAIIGDSEVNALQLRNVKTGVRSTLDVSGIFVSIGQHPNTEYLRGLLSLDENGQVITNDRMETQIPGIFAAGDIRHNSARQAITAAGDGATAAISAERYLSRFR